MSELIVWPGIAPGGARIVSKGSTMSSETRVPITPAQERILGVLARQPSLAVADIAAQAFVGVSTLAGYISALKARHLIYVSGWRKVKGRFATPLYSAGDKADVERPRIDETSRDSPGMDRIVDALTQFGGLTYREIAQATSLSPNTVKNSGYLNALLAQGRIHIARWNRSRQGPMSPVYVAGPGDDATKPAVLTSGEKNRRHRARRASVMGGGELRTQLAGLIRAADRIG